MALKLWIVAGIGLCMGLGCARQPTVGERDAALVRLVQDEAQAAVLRERIKRRTVLIAHTQMVPPRNGSLGLRFGWGTGALLSDDGYILTAAHCVPRDAATAVSYQLEGKQYMALARTVWIGSPDARVTDVALLKIEVEGLDAFDWAPARTISPETSVLVAGFSTRSSGGPAFSAGVGSIVSPTGERARGLPTTLVRFTGPLGHGDSGGPLTTPDGQLIGVHRGALRVLNASMTPVQLLQGHRIMCAIRPDPAWVARLIATDRHATGAAALAQIGS